MILTRYLESIKLDQNQNLLINFLSGDAVIADNKELSSLINLKLDRSSLEFWRDRGYIFNSKEDEDDEVHRIVELCSSVEAVQGQVIATIVPTYSCNCRCSYCFEGDVTRRNEVLTFDMVDKIFEILNERKISEEHPLNITLFGGEPLLVENYHLVEKIFQKSTESNGRIAIITNGTTLDSYVDLLKETSDLPKFIQITIDGTRDVHDSYRKLRDGGGTFDMIMENVALTLDKVPGISIVARTNVSNQDPMPILTSLFNEYEKHGLIGREGFSYYTSPVVESYGGCQSSTCVTDVHEFTRNIVRGTHSNNPYPGRMNWVVNSWQTSLLQGIIGHEMIGPPQYKGCGAANPNSLVFGPEGYLYACWNEVGIKENVIGEWYPSFSITDYGNQWRMRSFPKISECSSCKYSFVCAGGCGKKAERKHGKIYSPSCEGEEREAALLHFIAVEMKDELLPDE